MFVLPHIPIIPVANFINAVPINVKRAGRGAFLSIEIMIKWRLQYYNCRQSVMDTMNQPTNNQSSLENTSPFNPNQSIIQPSQGIPSHSYTGSLLNKFQPQSSPPRMSKNKDHKSQLFFIHNIQQKGQFIAYCIASKQSKTGITSNQRLLVIDSMNKQIKYYSKIPSLPLKSIGEIGEDAKQILSIKGNSNKVSVVHSKNGIGGIQINFVSKGVKKQWKLRVSSNALARQLLVVIDQIKNDRHLQNKQKTYMMKIQKPQAKVNNKATPFIADLKRLEQDKVRRSGMESMLLDSVREHPTRVEADQGLPMEEEKLEDVIRDAGEGSKDLAKEDLNGGEGIRTPSFMDKKEKENKSQKNIEVRKEKVQVKEEKVQVKEEKVQVSKKIQVSRIVQPSQSQQKQYTSPQPVTLIQPQKSHQNNSRISQPSQLLIRQPPITSITLSPPSPYQKQSRFAPTPIQNQYYSQNQNRNTAYFNVSKQNNKQHVESVRSIKINQVVEEANKHHAQRLYAQRLMYQNYRSNEVQPQSRFSSRFGKRIVQEQKQKKQDVKQQQISKKQIKKQTNDQVKRTSQNQKDQKYEQKREKQQQDKRQSQSRQSKTIQSRRSSIVSTPTQPKQKQNPAIATPIQPRQKQKPAIATAIQPRQKQKPAIATAVSRKSRPKLTLQSSLTPSKRSIRAQPIISTPIRQTLLYQSQLKSYSTAQKAKNNHPKPKILNQHSHPRRQTSRSPQQKLISKRQQLVLKWFNANTPERRAQIYVQFVQKCKNKINKMVQDLQSWHLFHREMGGYRVVEQGVEYTYEMGQSISLDKNMANYMYAWQIINQIDKNDIHCVVPLICMVSQGTLQVFCKAQLPSDHLIVQQIRNNHIHPNQLPIIQNIIKKAKLDISDCIFTQIRSQKQSWICFDALDLLPSLPGREQVYVDGGYIREWIQEGWVLSGKYLNDLQNNIKTQIVPKFLNQLNRKNFVSPLQFTQFLQKHSLNPSLLQLIYTQSLLHPYQNSTKFLLTQLSSIYLSKQFIKQFHILLITPKIHNKQSQIYDILQRVLRFQDKYCFKLKERFGIDLKEMGVIQEYLVCSLMIKLGASCRIVEDIRLEQLQGRYKYFWRDFQITSSSIQLVFKPVTTLYSYRYFTSHLQWIQSTLLLTPKSITPQQILSKLNSKTSNISSSPFFKLLPLPLQYTLSHILPPSLLPPLNPSTSWQLSYYPTTLSHTINLSTIQQLIQQRQFSPATHILEIQMKRTMIWASRCSQMMLGVYQIAPMLWLLRGEDGRAREKAMVGLGFAIQFWGKGGEVGNGEVWKRAYMTANLHARMNQVEEALNLYMICQKIFQTQMETWIVKISQNNSYLSPFFLKAQLMLSQGMIQQSISQCHSSLTIYNKLPLNTYGLAKHQIKTYFILIRCTQINRNYWQLLDIIDTLCRSFIQKGLMGQGQMCSQEQFLQIMRYMWHSVIVNTCREQKITYNGYFSGHTNSLPMININKIRQIVITIQKQTNNGYIFTQEEALSYLANRIQRYQQNQPTHKQSVMLGWVVGCLCELSKAQLHRKDAQEDQNMQMDDGDLQMLSVVMAFVGYEYALGAIQCHPRRYYKTQNNPCP